MILCPELRPNLLLFILRRASVIMTHSLLGYSSRTAIQAPKTRVQQAAMQILYKTETRRADTPVARTCSLKYPINLSQGIRTFLWRKMKNKEKNTAPARGKPTIRKEMRAQKEIESERAKGNQHRSERRERSFGHTIARDHR